MVIVSVLMTDLVLSVLVLVIESLLVMVMVSVLDDSDGVSDGDSDGVGVGDGDGVGDGVTNANSGCILMAPMMAVMVPMFKAMIFNEHLLWGRCFLHRRTLIAKLGNGFLGETMVFV